MSDGRGAMKEFKGIQGIFLGFYHLECYKIRNWISDLQSDKK